MASAPAWSKGEDRILRESFPEGGSALCSDMLARTRGAVNRRAAIIGVQRAHGWRRVPLTRQIGACLPKRPAAERFRNGFDVVDECWIWRGAKSDKGYATFRDDSGKKVAVHRWAYERAFGPVGEGLVLDHLCRNPGCCNPAHLEAVTNSTNVLRGKRSALKSAPTECKHGHAYPGNERRDKHGHRSCKECARINGRKYDADRRARR